MGRKKKREKERKGEGKKGKSDTGELAENDRT